MVAIRILLGRGGVTAADPMHVLLSVSSGVMFVLAISGILVGMIGVWVLFVPLPLAFVVLILMVVDRTRRSEHRGLVGAGCRRQPGHSTARGCPRFCGRNAGPDRRPRSEAGRGLSKDNH